MLRTDPTICLVTDRSRLPNGSVAELVRLVAAASAAGVELIQARERGLDDRRLLDLARQLVSTVEATGARVLVNDRTDVAIAGGAAGVHLRESSVPADRARSIVDRDFIVGRSVHSREAAIAAAATPVDYLVMGTIFPTPSKDPGVRPAGVRRLTAVCRAVACPVLAIGGITVDRAYEVAAAGAAGVAAVGLFADAFRTHDGRALEPALRALVAGMREAFSRGRDGSRVSISAD